MAFHSYGRGRLTLGHQSTQNPSEPVHLNELRRQQQAYVVRRVPMMSAVNIANSTLILILFFQDIGVAIVAWYAAIFVGASLQLLGWLKLRNREIPAVVSGKSLKRAEYWSVLMGSLWGALAFVAFPIDNLSLQMFIAVVVCGMTSGTTAILAPLPRLAKPFIVTGLAPLMVRFIIEGDPIQLVLAGLSISLGVALIKGSEWSFNQFEEMVRSSENFKRAQKNLVNAIESTSDAFAIFAPGGELVVANEKFSQWFPNGIERSHTPNSQHVFEVSDGRWLKGGIREVSGGGLVSVHTDVSELKEREEQLVQATKQADRARAAAEEARIQAEEADRAKTEFLANMSHELRTPLNAIIGFSEIMKGEMMGPLGSDRYKGYATDIFTSATHLLSIMSDILDLSRIETSNYKINQEPSNLIEIVDFVATLCRAQKDGTTRQIEVDCDPSITALNIDQAGDTASADQSDQQRH